MQGPCLSLSAAICQLRVIGEHRTYAHQDRVQLKTQRLSKLTGFLRGNPPIRTAGRADPSIQRHGRLCDYKRAACPHMTGERFYEPAGIFLQQSHAHLQTGRFEQLDPPA
jgi:hypothetical protein